MNKKPFETDRAEKLSEIPVKRHPELKTVKRLCSSEIRSRPKETVRRSSLKFRQSGTRSRKIDAAVFLRNKKPFETNIALSTD
jgi:hypothetical protein